jgi:alpha-L-fucosidase
MSGSTVPDNYVPTWESLDSHDVPKWFHDAKLGIFIHWGPYSVPAWAPTGFEISESLKDGFTDSPYAEWYPYFMYEEGSQTYEYHREEYGDDAEYEDFIDEWEAENWDPDEWAEFFDDIGARYVVFTGEHHDGFPLWDSHYTKHNAAERGPKRDLVGDLCSAVRDRGLRFAASYHANFNYYQPGFDGQFGHPDFEGGSVLEDNIGPGSEYVDFMNAKHRELIRKYKPDLLWFDVPKADSDHLNAKELIADYYNYAAEWGKDVVVNDRSGTDSRNTLSTGGPEIDPDELHADFCTPEYETFEELVEVKWEANRGISNSFGYNAAEDAKHHLDGEELVHNFIDIVSKNGNLLINVGPKADGTIPDLQREPLETLGEWLDTNSDAIFGTRYWVTAEEPRQNGVRYTWNDGTLYAICMHPLEGAVKLSLGDGVDPTNVESVSIVGGDAPEYDASVDSLSVTLPESIPTEHATALRIEGLTDPRS